MREIITLQLGHQANYLGTHFWNAQESYFTYAGDDSPSPVDHDVHFRPGIGADGAETFTPRALIYDLKGGFGSMKRINALYEMDDGSRGDPQVLWDRGVAIQREPTIETIEYQKNLDAGLPSPHLDLSSVRYWSDFNRVYYHPRSSIQLSEYDLNSTVLPFESYGLGRDLFAQLNREHDLLDRDFRLFAEECDQMQGVQVFTSAEDAWGGFAAEYVAALRDEYSKVGIVTWGLEDGGVGGGTTRRKQVDRTVNLAYTLSNIIPLTSLYIPLLCPLQSNLPPYIDMNPTSWWHKSALLSAALETSTLPTRLHDSVGSGRLGRLDDLASLLSTSGAQKIATLAMTLPGNHHPALSKTPKPKTAADELELSWDSGGPGSNRGGGVSDKDNGHTFAKAQVVRSPNDDDQTVDLSGNHPDAIFERYLTPFTYPIIDSFPAIFLPNQDQAQNATQSAEDGLGNRLPISTTLTSSSAVIPRLRGIKQVASRALGVHEREAIANDLGEFVEAYEAGWKSGSDDFDD